MCGPSSGGGESCAKDTASAKALVFKEQKGGKCKAGGGVEGHGRGQGQRGRGWSRWASWSWAMTLSDKGAASGF